MTNGDLIGLVAFGVLGLAAWAVWYGAFRSCSRCLPSMTGGGPCHHQRLAKQIRVSKKTGTYREPAEWYVCSRCAAYGTDPLECGCARPANQAAHEWLRNPPGSQPT